MGDVDAVAECHSHRASHAKLHRVLPNVLFVTADQWRGDSLSCAGHPVVRTPNLDRLATSGVRFARHFAQAAPCGPSRASLYTGMYLMNHRSATNGTPLDARHTNVALEARKLGYRPALFGYTDTSVDPGRSRPTTSACASTKACCRASIRSATCPKAIRQRVGSLVEEGLRRRHRLAAVRRRPRRRLPRNRRVGSAPRADAVRGPAQPDRVPHRPPARVHRSHRPTLRGSRT